MKLRYTLKSDCDLKDMRMISPTLMIMFATVLEFADTYNLPVKITSIISDRINVVSKSKTHETGRALDFSVAGWSSRNIGDLTAILLEKHEEIAAISSSDLKPKPLVCHDYLGQGSHCHLQSKR